MIVICHLVILNFESVKLSLYIYILIYKYIEV